eukprot:675290-Rhodomonas_salina.1
MRCTSRSLLRSSSFSLPFSLPSSSLPCCSVPHTLSQYPIPPTLSPYAISVPDIAPYSSAT